jgi:hypothetical protein
MLLLRCAVEFKVGSEFMARDGSPEYKEQARETAILG